MDEVAQRRIESSRLIKKDRVRRIFDNHYKGASNLLRLGFLSFELVRIGGCGLLMIAPNMPPALHPGMKTMSGRALVFPASITRRRTLPLKVIIFRFFVSEAAWAVIQRVS